MPDKIQALFKSKSSELRNKMVLIAENAGTNRQIYMTASSMNPTVSGYPMLLLFHNNEVEKRIFLYDERRSDSDAGKLFDEVFPDFNWWEDDGDEGAPDDEPEDMDDVIYQREDALYFSARDFLATALQVDEDSLPDFRKIDDFLDHTLTYLAKEGHKIYRPTYITDDETGEDSVVEYPYNSKD
jgi:hypothetical protein